MNKTDIICLIICLIIILPPSPNLIQDDPTKYKQQLEAHNKNIEIGLNQLEKLDKYPTTGYYIDRTALPTPVKTLGDVYLRGIIGAIIDL